MQWERYCGFFKKIAFWQEERLKEHLKLQPGFFALAVIELT